jgi:very-short-patch-repair endonuclease
MTETPVYATRMGSRYHTTADCSALADGHAEARQRGMKNHPATAMSARQAQARGLEPCSRCVHAPRVLQDVPASWARFVARAHRNQVWDSPYEAEFLRRVLVHVPGLDPQKTLVQHSVEVDGRRHRLDFAVLDGDVRLAVEVDGYAKDPGGSHVTPAAFDAWTRRQTALTSAGWRVLRFTNRQTMHEPDACIRQLELTLRDTYGKASPASSSLDGRELDELRRLQQQNATELAALRSTMQRKLRTQKRVEARPAPATPKPAPAAAPDTGGGRGKELLAWLVGTAAIVAAVWGGVSMVFPSGGTATPPPYSAPEPRDRWPALDDEYEQPAPAPAPDSSGDACPDGSPIKGNLSSSGERIYHAPGWRYYDATVPEQCFASETAAESAGFRASKVQ